MLVAVNTAQPDANHAPAIDGFTPLQIRHAYGFDKITLDGAGQTIAIVDAFDDPNIVADLKVFDAKFNLPDVVINKFNQNGRRVRGVSTDEGWASEIALDVEWAHAIAPRATIALIETNSDNTDDLLAGVNAARALPGVSVVSLSWGSDEYSDETSDDATFSTPRGHSGVTFVAASGDEGKAPAEWPATSPNVIAVGGTSLKLTAAGDYYSESVWSDTTGGTSKYETLPAFQTGVTGTKTRSTPDVSFNGNPDTGFAVYDSFGSDGWTVLAGTSAGVPQWAALVALANQSRVDAGNLPLDGPSGTLPALYSVYGTAAPSTTYTASYYDVTTGSNTKASGGGRGGWGGQPFTATADCSTATTDTGTADTATADAASATPVTPTIATTDAVESPSPVATPDAHSSQTATPAASGTSASVGYDQVSGLGSPKAPAVIDALANYVPPATSRRRHRAVAAVAVTKAHHSIARQNPPAQADAQAVSAGPASAVSQRVQSPPTEFAFTPAPASVRVPSVVTVVNSIVSVTGGSAAYSGFVGGTPLDAGGSHVVDTGRATIAPVSTPVSTPVSAVTLAATEFAVQAAGAADVLAPSLVGPMGSTFAFAPSDVGSTFFDAMSLFAHESTQALVPGTVAAAASAAAPRFGSPRAWGVTIGVLALDAILLGRWMRARAKNCQEELDLDDVASPFAFAPASSLVDDRDEYYRMA